MDVCNDKCIEITEFFNSACENFASPRMNKHVYELRGSELK